MSEHLAIDFLRRRYANAIARDDLVTACRLRQQLDQVMNRAGRAEPRSTAVLRADEAELVTPLDEPSGQRALRLAPRQAFEAPVTGLLEIRPVRSPLAGTVPL